MTFLEKDLEEIIYESFNKDSGKELKARGLPIYGKIKRQLKIGNYGIADLVTFEKDYDYIQEPLYQVDDVNNKTAGVFHTYVEPKPIITIYELKKDKIGISAFLQAIRYAKGIKRYLNKYDTYFEIRIVLIGKEIDISGSFPYLVDIFENIEFYTYKYEVDGLKFYNINGCYLIEEGFKIKI